MNTLLRSARGLTGLTFLVLALGLSACTGQQPQVEQDQAGAVSASVEDGQVWHFGYGSNLSSEFMLQYCPNLEFVMRAELPNYEVQFRYYSENRQGGISSIIEAPGEVTRGVIYSMPTAEMDALDITESVPEGLYTRETFLVCGEDGHWHEADLYRVAVPEGPFTPSASYLDLMITGAREHRLDPAYIEKLVALRASLD